MFSFLLSYDVPDQFLEDVKAAAGMKEPRITSRPELIFVLTKASGVLLHDCPLLFGASSCNEEHCNVDVVFKRKQVMLDIDADLFFML